MLSIFKKAVFLKKPVPVFLRDSLRMRNYAEILYVINVNVYRFTHRCKCTQSDSFSRFGKWGIVQ